MSAVRAAKTLSSDPTANRVDLQAMQDVLYDILATGVDAEPASASVEAVERFLHEHARSPKSPAEFAAFFARHGLTVSGRASRPSPVVALPPIQRPLQAEAPMLKFPVELAATEDAADEALLRGAPFAPHALAKRPSSLRSLLVWASALAALVALSAVSYVGYVTITDLEQRLDRSHQAAQADREAIQALEDQQVDLESNVAASAQIIERMDHKSDLILETIQPADKKPYRRR
jgi:hypothetical protein